MAGKSIPPVINPDGDFILSLYQTPLVYALYKPCIYTEDRKAYLC